MEGRWLLAEDMLAGLERSRCDLEMLGGRCHDGNKIDVGIGEDRAPAVVRAHAELVGDALRSIEVRAGDRRHLQTCLAERGHLHTSSPTGPDDSDSRHERLPFVSGSSLEMVEACASDPILSFR